MVVAPRCDAANSEEAIWLPGFCIRHGWNSMAASQFRFAALVVVLLAFAITYAAVLNNHGGAASYLFYGFCWIMLLNVFWHIGASFYFRAYAPGSITAVVLVLPISLYLIFCTRIRD